MSGLCIGAVILLLTFHRVKLPKSFLAVNLSESHTFHKKEEVEESIAPKQTTIADLTAEPLDFDDSAPSSLRTNNVITPELTTEAPTPTSLEASADIGTEAEKSR